MSAAADPSMPTESVFARIEAGAYAQVEAETRIEEILGVELLGISFDEYDSSFEIFPMSETEDVAPTQEQHTAILALGCSRYWINFADGTERYCLGERKQSGSNRWNSHNTFKATKRDAAQTALASFGAWCAREFRDSLSDVDGGSAQDAMERFGVIVKNTVTEPCGESCVCIEYGEFPHDCYTFSNDVSAAIAAHLAAATGSAS